MHDVKFCLQIFVRNNAVDTRQSMNRKPTTTKQYIWQIMHSKLTYTVSPKNRPTFDLL